MHCTAFEGKILKMRLIKEIILAFALVNFAVLPPSTWSIRSVSSMKETKDKVCNPDSPQFVEAWMTRAKQLGVNYVSIETPYDNPPCGDSIAYTNLWIKAARKNGLLVWHRHAPLAFEGIYGVNKTSGDYIDQISTYIKTHPEFFAPGDIFTPIPEPQNGGIVGINACSGICQFYGAVDFNNWLIKAINSSRDAFAQINLKDQIKIGYYGFDGFIAWGDHNPDWQGILDESTVLAMGNITIDHYPQLVGETMLEGLEQLQSKYPGVPIVIGEWGAVLPDDPQKQINDAMSAAQKTGVVGFNYWHLGMGGNEALINSDFSKKPQYELVKRFFNGLN